MEEEIQDQQEELMDDGDDGLKILELKPGDCIHVWSEAKELGEPIFLIKEIIEKNETKITFIADKIYREFERFDEPGKFSVAAKVSESLDEDRYATPCDINNFKLFYRAIEHGCEVDDGDVVNDLFKKLFEIENIELGLSI